MTPLPPLGSQQNDPNGANEPAQTNETGPFDSDVPEDSAASDEVAETPDTPVTYATNTDGIAGVVVHQTATENDDEPTGRVVGAAIVSETGEISSLATPLNNRDIIDPSADNRHPNPVPRPPLHVYEDNSPDKPNDDSLLNASDFEVAAVDLQKHGNTTFADHAENTREGTTV